MPVDYQSTQRREATAREKEVVLRLSGAMLERARDAQIELPAFPALAGEVLNIMERPDPDVARLIDVVRHDAMISAQVLRTANSAFYSRGTEVTSVQAAVVRLGGKAIANIALAAATRALLDEQERDYHDCFREQWHSLARYSLQCAASSRWLAMWLSRGAPEEAFLGGLMHDLGKMVALRLAGQMVHEGDMAANVGALVLEQVIEATHVVLGARLAAAWNLPTFVGELIEKHHQATSPPGARNDLLHVVRLASALFEWRTNPLHRVELQSELALSAEALELAPEPVVAIAQELKRLGTAGGA